MRKLIGVFLGLFIIFLFGAACAVGAIFIYRLAGPQFLPTARDVARPLSGMMHGPRGDELVAVAIVFISCATVVIIIFLMLYFKVATKQERSRSLSPEDSQTIEETWEGLQKMEDRIANLETILMHRRGGRHSS
jgi:phage shock protein B